jgi:hypothetical protein
MTDDDLRDGGARRGRRWRASLGVSSLALMLSVLVSDPALGATARAGDSVAAAFLAAVTPDSFAASATVGGQMRGAVTAPLSGRLQVAPGAFLIDANATLPDGTVLPVRRLARTDGGSWFTFPVQSYAWAPDPMTWGDTAPTFGAAFRDVTDAHAGEPVDVDDRTLVTIDLPGLDVHALGRSLGLADPDPARQPVSATAAFFASVDGRPERLRLVQDFDEPVGDFTLEYDLTFSEIGEPSELAPPQVTEKRFDSKKGRYSLDLPLGWVVQGDPSEPIVEFRSMNGPLVIVFPAELTYKGRKDRSAEALEGMTAAFERQLSEALPVPGPLSWHDMRVGRDDWRIAVAPFTSDTSADQLLMVAGTVRGRMGYTFVWQGSGWGADAQEAFFRYLLEGFRPRNARERSRPSSWARGSMMAWER